VYAFEPEPEPVELPDGCILLDRDGVVAVNKPAWLPVQGTRASQLGSLERLLAERLRCPGLRAIIDRQTAGAPARARRGPPRSSAARSGPSRRDPTSRWCRRRPDEWSMRGPSVGAERRALSLSSAPGGADARDSERAESSRARASARQCPITGRTRSSAYTCRRRARRSWATISGRTGARARRRVQRIQLTPRRCRG
jgi:hypothetical protein